MPTPLRHPWSLHRINSGFTQESLADAIGVSRHMVIRLEQGLFPEPPPALLVKIGFKLEVNLEELLKEYHAYVKDTRAIFRENHTSFQKFFRFYDVVVEEQHPLEVYREVEGLSRIGFCKELCIHQDPIFDYENNKQRGVPSQLKQACSDMFWDYTPLESAVAEWRIKWR